MKEQDIPIIINVSKLLDWLINRRHCNRNWQTKILEVRSKINRVIQDMPVDKRISELVAGTHINYFHCKKIVEILKETDTKNMFGQYKSQHVNDWQDIIYLYEKEHLYLAEAAQILIRNIQYEVPSLKKQIQKCDSTNQDLQKKETDLKKSENVIKSEFNNLCKQMGICGDNIKNELIECLSELPEIYDKIIDKTKTLDDVTKIYSTFLDLTSSNRAKKDCLPIIQYLIDGSNAEIFEAINKTTSGLKNTKIELEDDEAGEIDFGPFDEETEITVIEPTQTDIKIQSDDEYIDFTIESEGSDPIIEVITEGSSIEAENTKLTLIDNPTTRNDFIDQLLELEAFLKLRLYDMKNEKSSNLISTGETQSGSRTFELTTSDIIQKMLNKVQNIVSDISNTRVQHLLHMKHSGRYVDVLTKNFEQKRVVIDKIVSMQDDVRAKRDVNSAQRLELQKILVHITQKTVELQTEIEKDISQMYKNREVQITGGVSMTTINSLLL